MVATPIDIDVGPAQLLTGARDVLRDDTNGLAAQVSAYNTAITARGWTWTLTAPADADIQIGERLQDYPDRPTVRITARQGKGDDYKATIGLTDHAQVLTAQIWLVEQADASTASDELDPADIQRRAHAMIDCVRAVWEHDLTSLDGVYHVEFQGGDVLKAVRRRDSTITLITEASLTVRVRQRVRSSFGVG